MSEEINANNPSEVIYDESKIRHLEDTEHIRTRPCTWTLSDGSCEDGAVLYQRKY